MATPGVSACCASRVSFWFARLERLRRRSWTRLEAERDPTRVVDGVAHHRLLEALLAQLVLVELLLQHDALALALVLVFRLGGQHGAQLHHVVGEQPRLGIADDGGDALRLASDLGLAPERLQLSPDLAGEVAQTREVGLHRLELAQRLLFATPVLEDARGLLDEPAALLRRGAQHGVELALPHDHVHLAAETGVAQQLLHVEQAAVVAVDRVLAAAVAEQRAADRHLGVVDRQRAVGVVDGQDHLRTAERAPGRGAGEDDVLHLAAAEGLDALLAHHPGERVDDVALARAVRPDDAGDSRLECERGRLGERLEPFEGEALEIHGRPSRSCRRAAALRRFPSG